MKLLKPHTLGFLTALCLVLMSFNASETTKPASGINNTFEGDISLETLKALDELTIDAKGENLTVISFRFVVAPRKGEAYMKTFNGNRVSGTALNKVKSASAGDRILVDKVVAQYANGLKTFCNPAMHTLID